MTLAPTAGSRLGPYEILARSAPRVKLCLARVALVANWEADLRR